MNMIYVLVVGLFSTGAGDFTSSSYEFKTMEECTVAAEQVVDSYQGKVESRISAFCVPDVPAEIR